MNTWRFQPKATEEEEIGSGEGVVKNVGGGEEAGVAQKIEESDVDVGRSR